MEILKNGLGPDKARYFKQARKAAIIAPDPNLDGYIVPTPVGWACRFVLICQNQRVAEVQIDGQTRAAIIDACQSIADSLRKLGPEIQSA